MTNSTLCLHAGGTEVTRDQLMVLPEVVGTDTWFPTPHGQVLETVENTLQEAGFAIAIARYAVAKDNARFFATLDLTSQLVDGVSLAVGIRNSVDKSFPIGLTAGSRVFVCDNLAFNSDIYVAKRHTRFGKDRFDEGIAKSMTILAQYQKIEQNRIEHYQSAELSDMQACATILYAYEQGIISTPMIEGTIKEWREPSHVEFAPRTAWSVFNCMTEVLKPRQSQPSKFAKLTMSLYGLIDKISGYQAKPVIAI